MAKGFGYHTFKFIKIYLVMYPAICGLIISGGWTKLSLIKVSLYGRLIACNNEKNNLKITMEIGCIFECNPK